MTLRDWMNEHFFESVNAYVIKTEDGATLDISWSEYEKYEFVKAIKGEYEDAIVVR